MRFVRASGSFYNVALKVGEECRSDIPEVYDRGVEYLLKHTRAGSLERINQIASRYMASSARLWPDSVKFLEGLAAGANVPLQVILLTAFTEEISSEVGVIPAEKCSTLVVRLPNGYHLIVHNEDYEKQNFGKMVLLDAVFDGYPRSVGMSYSGQLFNLAGSINSHLVAITNNSFYPLAQPGNSKQVLHCRASLTHCMRGAVNWLSLQNIAVTTHFVVAHGETGEVISLAVSNSATASKVQDILQVQDLFYCTNNVPTGRLGLKNPDPAVEEAPNSFVRYDYLANLCKQDLPQTPQDALNLFSRRNNNALFRVSEEEGASVTLATVVICPETGEMWVRDADPQAECLDWYFSVK